MSKLSFKYYVSDEDGYKSEAIVTPTSATVTTSSGVSDSLIENEDGSFIFKSVNYKGEVKVIDVPPCFVFDLPILVTLLAKHTNLMSPVTIVEAGKIIKLFSED